MTGKYEIAIVLTVLSFGLPVLYFILTRRALTPFSLRQLTKSFNFALIVQIILAGIFTNSNRTKIKIKSYKNNQTTHHGEKEIPSKEITPAYIPPATHL